MHAKMEEGRVAVRNVRRHAHDALRKAERDGDITKDDLHQYESDLQTATDSHIATIDEEGKRKENDLLEV